MKRAGNLLVVLFLVVATGGIPFTRHYCGSSAGSFSVFSTPEPCCDDDCDQCHNVFSFSRINDDFEAASEVTTQKYSDIIILQSAISADLPNDVLVSPFPYLINKRKFLITRAGPTPAFLANFRC